MEKRYSIEYCGHNYLLVERTQNKIIFEAGNYIEVDEYAKQRKIKLIKKE